MTSPNYEQDFHAWSQAQADLLRARRFEALDLDHLIEELEGMGARERRELISRLKVLLAHLLKWQYQPHLRSRSWAATIKEQRLSLETLLEDNPSLRASMDQHVQKAYRMARLLAVKETNLEEHTFPEACPYSLDEIETEDFFPAPRHPDQT